jgi:hypothetical protein
MEIRRKSRPDGIREKEDSCRLTVPQRTAFLSINHALVSSLQEVRQHDQAHPPRKGETRSSSSSSRRRTPKAIIIRGAARYLATNSVGRSERSSTSTILASVDFPELCTRSAKLRHGLDHCGLAFKEKKERKKNNRCRRFLS